MIKNVVYEVVYPLEQTEELISECAMLYSTHYGKWGKNAVDKSKIGQKIKLSPARLCSWLDNKNTLIYVARLDKKIIAYAIAIRIKVPYWGMISWVTQLVVDKNYRNQEVAKNLLFSIWGASDDYAWGIISANPYAIRALEKATRRRANTRLIKEKIDKIISIGSEHIPYMNKNIEHIVDAKTSKVNTNFFIDHSPIEDMIKGVVSKETPWTLGGLNEGWEWLAFTFKQQKQIQLTPQEIESMIQTSDVVTKQAYERMQSFDNHKWMQNTINEVDFIIQECNLTANDYVIDFGCGTGRHAIELGKRNIKVTAVDYLENNINAAKHNLQKFSLLDIEFIHGDCRNIKLAQKANAIICLYDVIGSYADNEQNLKILRNISNHLKIGGHAILSVMNFDMTNHFCKNFFRFSKNPNKLLELKTSKIMEESGNVFNPDYYMIDLDSNVVYRKERFERGTALPIELIVRDRRFNKNEIIQMCQQCGLSVDFARYVNARNWNYDLQPIEQAAKEILIKCTKQKDIN